MDEEDLQELKDSRQIKANDRYGEQSKDQGHGDFLLGSATRASAAGADE